MAFNKSQARQLCEDLSLSRNIPKLLRDQARHELYAVAWQAPELFPSWEDKRLDFCPPPGWRPMNWSITRYGNRIIGAVRASHYIIDDRGPLMIEGTPNFSRTFMIDIDPVTLADFFRTEIFLPEPLIERVPGVPAGLEDMRIFEKNGELWGIMVRCDQNEEGWPEQWLGRIAGDTFEALRKLKSPDKRRPEKNWMPIAVAGSDKPWFVYSCDPATLTDGVCQAYTDDEIGIAADHFRGSSQVIETGLAIVHTCTLDKLWPKNLFRFVRFEHGTIAAVSDAFRFPDRFTQEYLQGYQYVMGLCSHTDGERLLVSYSLGDGQSRLGTLKAIDVYNQLREI